MAAEYARLMLRIGNRGEAKKVAEEVLKTTPTQPVAAAVIAYLKMRDDKFDEAATSLEPAFDKEHPHKAVLDLLMKARLKQKRATEVLELCELGKLHFPYESAWWKGIAAAAKITGDVEKRRDALITLVSIEADDPAPRKALAELAIAEKDYEAAYKYARLALHIDVLDADIHRMLADACRERNDSKRAIDEYETVLELKPKDVPSQLGLAEVYLTVNRTKDARKLVDEVLKRDAENERAKSLLTRLKVDK